MPPSTQPIRLYVTIAFAIMTIACGAVVACNLLALPIYGTMIGFVAIAIGGLSTAIAGGVVAKRTKIISSYKKLVFDFFALKQPLFYYVCILVFLLMIFGKRMWNGQFQMEQQWILLPKIFVVSILFGGVEEIGWRYVFQPELEKKFTFGVSTLITFSLWAIWHIMFFIVDGSIITMAGIDILAFLLGLLGTSFVLGAIFYITKSLWLCVFYHAMLNALTQLFIETSLITTLCILMVSFAFSILCVTLSDRKAKKNSNKR